MSTRRSFIASAALTAALAAPAAAVAEDAAPKPAASPAPSAPPEAPLPPFAFDLKAFDRALGASTDHRHLFTSTKIAEGLVLGQMRGVVDAYEKIGVKPDGVKPVAVLYHGASVALAFDDTVWNEYFLPLQRKNAGDKEVAKDFATVVEAKTTGNPCLHATGKDNDASIEWLVKNCNAALFACDHATRGYAGFIAKELGLKHADVYAAMAAHLVPGAMLVPAGIWAVHAVQERRYTLLVSTL